MASWTFYPIFGSYLLVLILVGAPAALLYFLPPRRESAQGRRRTTLLVLRSTTLLLLAVMLLRPTVIYTETRKLAATVIVMADRSLSMTVNDEMNGLSRWDAAKRHLDRSAAPLSELDRRFDMKAYGFAEDLTPVKVEEGRIQLDEVSPDGRETAIGYALEQALDNEAGKRLLGVFVISDWAQRATAPRDTLPDAAAVRLRDAACPVFAMPVGKSRGLGQTQDVAVVDLMAPARVFSNNEMVVSGQIRVDGYANRDLPVRLMFENSAGEMAEVGAAVIRTRQSSELVPFEFRFVPTEPGEHKLTVEVALQQKELVETNNAMSAFVTVMEGGLRVLLIEGTWRLEPKFLRNALDASADIDVDYVRLNPRDPSSYPPDFDSFFEPGKYAVYILGDIDSSAFTEKQLQALADVVGAGAGLLMAGGTQTFGPGGYGETPLDDLSPVRMFSYERQRLGEPLRTDLDLPGPLRMRPTAQGAREFVTRLAPTADQSMEVWNELPTLEGADKFVEVKRAARVLAESGKGDPLLVVQEYGRGRVMALAASTTWRWAMEGWKEQHQRFWRQAVLWLAHKDETLEGDVWVRLMEQTVGIGQKVQFEVGAQTPLGETIADATGKAVITLPDGSERPVTLTREDGRLVGSFSMTDTPGDYAIRVEAEQDGVLLGEARSRFMVVARDLELDNAAADPRLAESVARTTGGRVVPVEELPSLVEELIASAGELEEKTETKRSLWDTWTMLILFVGLLTAEWYCRKRWGLV